MTEKRRFRVAYQTHPDDASDNFAHACLYSMDKEPAGKWNHVVTVEVVDEDEDDG